MFRVYFVWEMDFVFLFQARIREMRRLVKWTRLVRDFLDKTRT